MYPATAPRAYYPALDILRGCAILAVVFFHNFEGVRFFQFGWLGVDLFFVLSGFLITEILLSSLGNKFYFRNFFIRRVLRIFPLYYLILFLFFTLSPVLFSQKGPQSTFSYYNSNKIWFWGYIQNWLMVKNGPAPVPYLTHFWSLGVEEQFYFFWPFVLFCCRRLTVLKKVVIGLIVFSVSYRSLTWWLHPFETETYYCNTFTRMDALLIGSLLAIHLRQGKLISSILIKTIFTAFAVLFLTSLWVLGNLDRGNAVFATVGYTIADLFFAILLYLFISKGETLKHILHRLSALRFIGKISYGIYVYHVPIYLVLATQCSKVLNEFVNNAEETSLLVSILSVLITLAASVFSFYILEKPILSLKKYFP